MYILKLKNKTKYGKKIKKNQTNKLKVYILWDYIWMLVGKKPQSKPPKKNKKQKSKENFNSNDRSPVLQRRSSGTQISVILFNWDWGTSDQYAGVPHR
jgi:hypothetical protein